MPLPVGASRRTGHAGSAPRSSTPSRWRRTSLTLARGWVANSANERIRLKTENDRLRQEIGLLREEMHIKDCRMLQIPAQRRPHYPPVERLAILELRAARAWSLAKTAEHFLVTPLTIASWNSRLDEEGPDALVQIRIPVSRFPEFFDNRILPSVA